MKRIRNNVPSEESQKPSTLIGLLLPAAPNSPVTTALVNGFPGSAVLTLRLTSTKSYAATEPADCENATSRTAEKAG